MKAERSRSGFTLLEVMVATALFVSGMTLLIVAYSTTMDAIGRVQVNQGLEQDLAALRQRVLLLSDPLAIEEGGELLTGQHGLAHWNVEYEPTQVADLFLVTLDVELDPDDEEAPRKVSQSFYLTRPTWSDPIERSELRALTRDRYLEQQAQMR